MNSSEWNDTAAQELGVAVASYALALVNGRLVKRWTPRGLVSMHGLSRSFERTGSRAHAALMRDLAVLAAADGEGEKVPTPMAAVGLAPCRGSAGAMALRRGRGIGASSASRTWVDG
jgi:hypothetical protein